MSADAQSWQWANGENCGGLVGGGLGDGWLCRTDIFNNVYTGGIFSGGNHGDSICFGGNKFYRPALSANIVLNKYDTSGNVLWTMVSGNGQAAPYNITTDRSGNMYLFGYFWSDSLMFGNYLITNPYYDAAIGENDYYNTSYFILKFDTAGNVVWHKTGGKVMPDGYSLSVGGISCDKFNNIYVCGSFSSSSIHIGADSLVNAHDSTSDIFLAKYDSSGNVLWTKEFGGIEDDFGLGIAVSADGSPIITGTFRSPSIAFGTSSLTYSVGSTTAYDAPDIFLTKLDSGGSVVWTRNSSGSGAPMAIAADLANNVYISGTIYDSTSFSVGSITFFNSYLSQSGYLAKYDAAGNVIWAKAYSPISVGGGTQISIWGLTTDHCDHVWISGVMNGSSCYIDNTTIVYAPSGYSNPTLLVGYTENGALLYHDMIPNEEDDNSSLSSDALGNIYLSDDVTGAAILDTSVAYWWGRSGEAMFTAKFRPALECYYYSDVELTKKYVDNISLYPNPATTSLTITSPDKITQITITNLLGQTVYSSQFAVGSLPTGQAGLQASIDVASFPAGMYFVRVNDTAVRKFVKS